MSEPRSEHIPANNKFVPFHEFHELAINERDTVHKILLTYVQGQIGSPNFGGIFFQGAPKKIALKIRETQIW
jgi:hypothetical protein